MRGTVKWFSKDKGYGFIVPEKGEKDIFVHYNDIIGEGFKTLLDGQHVEFETDDGDRGLKAKDVKVVPLDEGG